MYSPKRRFRLFRGAGSSSFPDASTNDILTFARSLSTTLTSSVVPTSGGTLTINSQSVGNYEVTARNTNTTISSFTAADWFTSTKDTVSSWIIVNGDLTINSGQTLIPPARKLFTVVYVRGNLTLNGVISMTARGANHSGTGDSGGFTAPVDIRIGTGTFGGVTNPQIPAAGAAGGTGTSTDNFTVSGANGSAGATGGGGAGGKFGGTGRSGSGSAGTCFCAGGGGAGVSGGTLTAGSAVANGGRGGDVVPNGTGSGGGTGNPGGSGSTNGGPTGATGMGGTLIVIVEGSITGTGTFESRGTAASFTSGYISGGGSGGGSVNVLYKTDTSSTTTSVEGGMGTFSGSGGFGTQRKLAIGTN